MRWLDRVVGTTRVDERPELALRSEPCATSRPLRKHTANWLNFDLRLGLALRLSRRAKDGPSCAEVSFEAFQRLSSELQFHELQESLDGLVVFASWVGTGIAKSKAPIETMSSGHVGPGVKIHLLVADIACLLEQASH